jgi:DNA-binding transcriptional ArsR family regulator
MPRSERTRRITDVLKAVGHPVRLRVVELLCRGEVHVGTLARVLGVAQPIVSQQLRILRLHGLVAVTREAGHARYRLDDESLRDLVSWMGRSRPARKR